MLMSRASIHAFVLGAALVLAAPACDDSDSSTSDASTSAADGSVVGVDAGPDASSTDANPADAAEDQSASIEASADTSAGDAAPDGPICCPMDNSLSCDCHGLGGSPVNGVCPRVCDAPPGGTMTIDQNGCPVLTPPPGSCLPRPPDGGAQASDVP